MKKMTFKIKPKENFSLFPIIKEINLLSCRIYINLEGGIVELEDVDDTQLDVIIDVVANQFSILSVNIDNTAPVTAKTAHITAKEKNEKVVIPQTENDLIVKKVEFENELIEESLNKLAKTAYWAIFKEKIPEKDIERYFLSCQSEMSMEYGSKEIIDFIVGDIVDCNFGMHLLGEAQGAHILAIVCNISNNMACVVPIAKKVNPKKSTHSYMPISFSNDSNFYFEEYTDSFAILDRAKYVRVERFRKVMGHVKPAFFDKLLKNLAKVYDFTNTISDEKKTKGKEVEQICSEEAVLLEVVGPALNHLRPNVTPMIQAASFANEIGLETSNKIVIESFVYACNIKKINYENIIAAILDANIGLDENTIKTQLKETFKNWLVKHPEIVAKSPKISFTSLLKVFAKKFKTEN